MKYTVYINSTWNISWLEAILFIWNFDPKPLPNQNVGLTTYKSELRLVVRSKYYLILLNASVSLVTFFVIIIPLTFCRNFQFCIPISKPNCFELRSKRFKRKRKFWLTVKSVFPSTWAPQILANFRVDSKLKPVFH